MILKEVRLFPFGAIRDREYRFKRGLNVILGPNEAGKSTLVNAIFAALFLPPDLRRSSPDWKNFLVRYLPYPEGDTARVSLCFEDDAGRSYRYTCAWGEEKEARLVLENGEGDQQSRAHPGNSAAAPGTGPRDLPGRPFYPAG